MIPVRAIDSLHAFRTSVATSVRDKIAEYPILRVKITHTKRMSDLKLRLNFLAVDQRTKYHSPQNNLSVH